MRKYYIDFDGVIFDTDEFLFDEYHLLNGPKTEEKKISYMQQKNWLSVIRSSKEINNSIEIIKSLGKEAAILTKVHSMENEAVAKVIVLRELGITQEIIIVPFLLNKTDLVEAKNNILVDDGLFNLEQWEKEGGLPIFFNKDNKDIDTWNKQNKKYPKTNTLKRIREIYK